MTTLTHKQSRLIETAANGVRPACREQFMKYIGDILRAKLQPCDSDVWFASQAALEKYAEEPTVH